MARWRERFSIKIIVVGAHPPSLLNFRGDLIRSFIEGGNDVIAMANNAGSETISSINAIGAQYIDYPVNRNGLKIFEDFKTLNYLYRTFKEEKPDIILLYTIKPVIWGGIAARLNKDSFIGLITGLGFAFQGDTFKRKILTKLVKSLYRLALSKSKAVIFQNEDNLNQFVSNKIVSKYKCYRVYGSGVNLAHFEKRVLPKGGIIFTTIARLLGEKGLREYAEAAKLVKSKHPQTEFRIVGPADPSPDGIRADEIDQWQSDGVVQYLGSTEDVRPFLEATHIYVLASYHEGMPRTVLEAMAIGRPILTTNVPGCAETVNEGVNGWLFPSKDAHALAQKMILFIENRDRWQEMGNASRLLAEDQFDVRAVNIEIMKIMGLSL